MNRRSFLKSLTAVCGAAVVCPGELLKGEPMPKVGVGERSKHIVMGITNKQLCELIQTTLEDLPKTKFEVLPGIGMKRFYE